MIELKAICPKCRAPILVVGTMARVIGWLNARGDEHAHQPKQAADKELADAAGRRAG